MHAMVKKKVEKVREWEREREKEKEKDGLKN